MVSFGRLTAGSRSRIAGGPPAAAATLRRRAHRPQYVAPRQPHRGESVGACQCQDLALVQPAASPQVGRIAIGRGAALDHALHVVFPEAGDLPEAEAQGAASDIGLFQRAIPIAGIHVGRPHLDPVLPRIAHELGRRVKAHRLGVEQGGSEDLGIVVFHPGRDVDQDREARGMALGEAVFAEPLDLLEAAFGEFCFIAVLQHPADELFLELVDEPARRNVAMARRSLSALAGEKPAQSIAICIACS